MGERIVVRFAVTCFRDGVVPEWENELSEYDKAYSCGLRMLAEFPSCDTFRVYRVSRTFDGGDLLGEARVEEGFCHRALL